MTGISDFFEACIFFDIGKGLTAFFFTLLSEYLSRIR